MIRTIRQSLRQPGAGDFDHAIELFDCPFAHVAKHGPPVMKNYRRLARRRLSNRDAS
jgi:hypothetical protein